MKLYIQNWNVSRISQRRSLETIEGLSPIQTRVFKEYYGVLSSRLDSHPDQSFQKRLSAILKSVSELSRSFSSASEVIVFFCRTILHQTPIQSRALQIELSKVTRRPVRFVSVGMAHCASAISAIHMASNSLRPSQVGIILTGESPFHSSLLSSGTAIMSDTISAVVVGHTPSTYSIEAATLFNDGRFAITPHEPSQKIRKLYESTYQAALEKSILSTINCLDLNASQLRWVVPHHVNRFSFESFCEKGILKEEQLYLRNFSTEGHAFCGDPFINLDSMHSEGAFRTGDLALFYSSGLGASIGAMILKSN